MSEEFKIDIINPDKSFYSSEVAKEVVIPAFEGEIGILKDHIPIISFLKPGIIKIKLNNTEEAFYVEDGIIEFKDNLLSILTSSIIDIKKFEKSQLSENLKNAEKELENKDLNDQDHYLASQKVEVLKTIN